MLYQYVNPITIHLYMFHYDLPLLSADWFKGKLTGKPYIWWENLWFPVNFPLNQSIDTSVSWNRGTPKSSILIGFSLLNHPAIEIPPLYQLNNLQNCDFRCPVSVASLKSPNCGKHFVVSGSHSCGQVLRYYVYIYIYYTIYIYHRYTWRSK